MSMLIMPGRFGAGTGAPVNPPWDDVVSLVPFDGTAGSTVITDVKRESNLTVSGAIALSNAQMLFGKTSGARTGTGRAYRSPLTGDSLAGAAAYTIEGWIYTTSATQDAVLWAETYNNTTNYACLRFRLFSGKPGLHMCRETGETTRYSVIAPNALSANAWHHIAACRYADGTASVFVDGVRAIDGSYPTYLGPSTFVGYFDYPNGDPASSGTFYLSNGRVTNGLAVYTGDFTPPTAPFPDS